MVIGVFALGFIYVAWLQVRKWRAEDAAACAEREALNKQWDEESSILRYILDAPDSEFEGMSLAESMAVTREKGNTECPK